MAETTFDEAFAKRAAENYQRYFVPAIGAPVAMELVDQSRLEPGERVLDVACGTGVVARLAAGRVGSEGRVSGLDPNPGMLAVARETSPPELNLEWHRGPAEAIPLPDGSFDVVLCGMGLQFFSDREGGLREMRRVLVPGGRLVANVPGPIPPPLKLMENGIARHVSPESAAFVGLVFDLHDGDELRRLAEDAGFSEIDVRSDMTDLDLPPPDEFLWQYVESTPLAAAVVDLDEEARSALESEFVEGCAPFVSEGRMAGRVRMTTVLARA